MRIRIARAVLTFGLTFTAVAASIAPVLQTAEAATPRERREYVLFFNHDSAEVTPRAQKIIDQAVATIDNRRKSNRLANIKVIGYSDTADTGGDVARSLKLSADRAASVHDALAAAGVPAELMTTEARGKSDLAVKTRNRVSNIRNRRVRIVMFAPGE